MFQRVLVPLDGNETTEMVLPFVARIAQGLDAPVMLLTVIEGGESFARSRVYKRARGLAMDRLDAIAGRLMHDGLHVDFAVVPGRAAEAIVEVADASGCDLIAMTSYGGNVRFRGVLGSVTDRVVHTANIPVLTVSPERARMFGGNDYLSVPEIEFETEAPETRSALVALDGTALSETVLPYVVEFAKRLGLELVLVKSVRGAQLSWMAWEKPEGALEREGSESAVAAYLESVARELRQDGLEVETEVLTGHPTVSIMELAHNISPEVIAIATHRRSRWAVGSVAEALLRGSGEPILIIASRSRR